MAHLSGELKKLNSTKNAYFWTEIHEAEFKKLKEVLAQTATLDYFDQKKLTTLLTYAIRLGDLGFTPMKTDSQQVVDQNPKANLWDECGQILST